MGILDRKITNYVTTKQITVREVTDFLEKKIGDKYKVKLKEKGSVGKQMLSGQKQENIFVEKNGYHRCRIFLTDVPASSTESGKDEVYINITRAELNGILRLLDKELGMIGSFIISLIFGKATEFYEAISESIIKEYEVEEREVNVGVSALFKKNK